MERGNRGRGNRGNDNNRQRDDRGVQGSPSKSQACELFVNHFKLATQNVYAYLIDWGAKIPSDNKELKGDAKRSSNDELKKIFINYIFMHNYENKLDYLLSA